ncbi:MATE family efflux transporter [Pseudoflavonifractor sp. 60]|uniref:MATE family efflux transporter n=1 Tax=Pseudoflavonifractor sp. 60 TaxID=2304576 RepID=UPI001368764F|nr:MATE family efflux transporter [Pseudoflavonifractor sp. 60]NBI66211.1 MATE family efflux transporter [Pseudoflavonifractor sp. 60]
MDDNILDQKWSAGTLLRFAFPTIAMMIFMGLYTIVDTIFVAQFVNTDALSAINIVCPILNVTVGLGTMLAAGGNAIVARKMGAGDHTGAKEDFTLLILTGAVIGFLILLGGIIWIDKIIYALGASELLFPYCKDYLMVLFLFIPANILQTLFSNLFVTAGKPGLGCGLSALAGAANIILDYIFIVPCGLGIRGAALGTGCGFLIPAVAGLAYFARSQRALSFTRPKLKWAVIGESCFNGSSEMVGQLATAVTTFLFNRTMMNLLGEDGVAAITIIIYSQFLLNTLYIGYSIGVAPIIGFNYGSGNAIQQKRVFTISIRFIMAASALVFAVSMFGGPYIVLLFADDASEVYQIAANGFRIFSYSFLFCGLNNFTSAMFTALSNGRISAVLSFLRTFGLLAGGILLLPSIWDVTGIWLAVPAAEGIMFGVSIICLIRYKIWMPRK